MLALHGIRIVQIASGSNHVLALSGKIRVLSLCKQRPFLIPFFFSLSDEGAVYSWGSGKNGRLGHGNGKDIVRPKKIASLQTRVIAIACVR